MFKPMHDLESLTDAQREEHYLAACEHFQLPPELRLLDFMWMDASDAKRNLVLYAKKGATDLIRDRQDISVVSTVPANGPGYAAFIVEGKNKDGRHEFAVGSASIGGLNGQNLANAVMISHTRAVRRLTLQFVGGGLLDESEAIGPVTDINRAGGSLASLATITAPAQPTTTPNAQPGKDITPTNAQPSILAQPLISAQLAQPAQPSMDAPLITRFLVPMVAPAPFSSGSIIPTSVEQITETSQPLVQIEPAPGQKRHRRTKAETAATRGVISLDGPDLAVAETVAVSEIVEKPSELSKTTQIDAVSSNDDISESQRTATFVTGSNLPAIPTVMPKGTFTYIIDVPTTAPEPAVNPDTPTKEEVAAWKAKLSVYTTQGGILNQGGMTENIFGKIRLYTMTLFPNAVVLPNKAIMLTNSQWANLIATFEKISTEQGSAGLVAAIEAAKQ